MKEKLYVVNDTRDYDFQMINIYNIYTEYETAVNVLFKKERQDDFNGFYILAVYKYNKNTGNYDYETELSLEDLIKSDN